MKKYRKKPVIVEAKQWLKHGDHHKVFAVEGEGRCFQCDQPLLRLHGRVRGLEKLFAVCPGDWIVKNAEGEYYACKPSVFEKTYEEVK